MLTFKQSSWPALRAVRNRLRSRCRARRRYRCGRRPPFARRSRAQSGRAADEAEHHRRRLPAGSPRSPCRDRPPDCRCGLAIVLARTGGVFRHLFGRQRDRTAKEIGAKRPRFDDQHAYASPRCAAASASRRAKPLEQPVMSQVFMTSSPSCFQTTPSWRRRKASSRP